MAGPPQGIDYFAKERVLQITWGPGHIGRFATKYLRCECACAGCVDERTGIRTLDPNTVVEDIDIAEIEMVGNYAIRIRWSDGHDTGLYTWEHLARIRP